MVGLVGCFLEEQPRHGWFGSLFFRGTTSAGAARVRVPVGRLECMVFGCFLEEQPRHGWFGSQFFRGTTSAMAIGMV